MKCQDFKYKVRFSKDSIVKGSMFNKKNLHTFLFVLTTHKVVLTK